MDFASCWPAKVMANGRFVPLREAAEDELPGAVDLLRRQRLRERAGRGTAPTESKSRRSAVGRGEGQLDRPGEGVGVLVRDAVGDEVDRLPSCTLTPAAWISALPLRRGSGRPRRPRDGGDDPAADAVPLGLP